MYLAFIDNTGQVMATQVSPKAPAPTKWETQFGYERVEVDAYVTRDHKRVGGSFVENVNPVNPVATYDMLRRQAYPSTGDQLDMLYRDLKASGVNGEFTAAIEAVKNAHPKP